VRTIREQKSERDATRQREQEDLSEEQAEEALKPLGEEAPEVVDRGARIGAKRLARPLIGDAMTSFIGGMSVSFGAVALGWAAACVGGSIDHPSPASLVGSLAFPVGFLILLIGKSELFTENFFLPVTAVLERRGSLFQLLSLWCVSLAFNLVGCAVFAMIVSYPGVLDHDAAREIMLLAQHKMTYPFLTAFVKAIFAGWLMTLLTWLLVAARGLGPRVFIIWAIATLIVLGKFNHVVISASEIFMAMLLGAPIGIGAWFTKNFLPALAGNLLGGTVFVTLLFYVQAQYTTDSHGESPPESQRRPRTEPGAISGARRRSHW
jgi:formate/nitrite transporter FocA (FNT family)